MPSAYKPRAPKGVTDDYRCFLLDPKRAGDSFVTSARIEPGADKVVHHVILFRVAKAQVADAKGLDSRSAGLGWNCFGGTGLPAGSGSGAIQDSLNDANWVAAWAPGWGGNRLPEGTGVPLPAGSQIVMQVHYNLLNGRAPGPFAGAAYGRARSGEAHAAPDDAPAGAGRAGLRTQASKESCAPGTRRCSISRASTGRKLLSFPQVF